MGYSLQQNFKIFAAHLFWQNIILTFFKLLLQTFPLDIFHHNISLVRVYIAFMEPAYIWMIQFHQQSYFFSDILLVILINIRDFDSDIVSMLIRCEVNITERSITQLFIYPLIEIIQDPRTPYLSLTWLKETQSEVNHHLFFNRNIFCSPSLIFVYL